MNVHNLWRTKSPPFCLGHRGFPLRARENTLPSFLAALESGAAGVELDVVVTQDGVPCVHHNPTAWTGNAEFLIADLPWTTIQRTDFVAEGETYRIPGLASVLDGIGTTALVNVEIKPPRPGQAELTVESTLPILAGRTNVLVSSFDPGVLREIHTRNASIPLGYLFSTKSDLDVWGWETPVHALHPRRDRVDPELLALAREHDQRVYVWTVDDPAEAGELLGLGVDGVITNRPDLMEGLF